MTDFQLLIGAAIFMVLLYVFGMGTIHYYFRAKEDFVERLKSKFHNTDHQ